MQPGSDGNSGANSGEGPVTPEVVDLPMLLPEGSAEADGEAGSVLEAVHGRKHARGVKNQQ